MSFYTNVFINNIVTAYVQTSCRIQKSKLTHFDNNSVSWLILPNVVSALLPHMPSLYTCLISTNILRDCFMTNTYYTLYCTHNTRDIGYDVLVSPKVSPEQFCFPHQIKTFRKVLFIFYPYSYKPSFTALRFIVYYITSFLLTQIFISF